MSLSPFLLAPMYLAWGEQLSALWLIENASKNTPFLYSRGRSVLTMRRYVGRLHDALEFVALLLLQPPLPPPLLVMGWCGWGPKTMLGRSPRSASAS